MPPHPSTTPAGAYRLLIAALLGYAASSDAVADALPEVLTAEEAAALLRVKPKAVVQMAVSGDMPARRFGQDWRFNRRAVLAWLAGRDPVGAALLAEQPGKAIGSPSSAAADSANPPERLAQAELRGAVARGTSGEVDADKPATAQPAPETVGEKPATKTAEEVFLRDQAVLLKNRQATLELDLLYARSEREEWLPVRGDATGLRATTAELQADTYSSVFSARYGLFDNVQWFGSLPLSHRTEAVRVGSQTLGERGATRWGPVISGLRYAALAEGLGYPGVIVSLDGVFPIDRQPYGLGANVALTKSVDPAVLFLNAGYQHFFDSDHFAATRLTAENEYQATAGIAYALNDTLLLSTSLSALFLSRTLARDGLSLPSRELYSLRFSVTSLLADGLYVEPFVTFALNGTGSNLSLGLNLPYTF